MDVCSLSGNEIYCLALKGFFPREIVVGNSVRSLGLAGAIGSGFRTLAGGEVENVTALISEGRHAAIARLVEEAQRERAHGVTGVTTELSTLAGYTEFLSQGTSLMANGSPPPFFTTSASGTELFCHLEAGYTPVSFVMGNVAYALGLGRGIAGGLSTLARGEVRQYSEMYNRIRHLALFRLRREAASVGANAVVDVRIDIRPFGAGVVELLMTGTASHHAALGADERIGRDDDHQSGERRDAPREFGANAREVRGSAASSVRERDRRAGARAQLPGARRQQVERRVGRAI